MRRYAAKLYKLVETGRNKLGTPVSEEIECGFCLVRKAPASADLVNTEGNDAHILTRTFATKKPAIDFRGVSSFEVRGIPYQLTDVAQTDMGTLITGTFSKPEVFYESQDNAEG